MHINHIRSSTSEISASFEALLSNPAYNESISPLTRDKMKKLIVDMTEATDEIAALADLNGEIPAVPESMEPVVKLFGIVAEASSLASSIRDRRTRKLYRSNIQKLYRRRRCD